MSGSLPVSRIILNCAHFFCFHIKKVRQNESYSVEGAGHSVGHGDTLQLVHGDNYPGCPLCRKRGPAAGSRDWLRQVSRSDDVNVKETNITEGTF